MISTGELKKGATIELDGKLFSVMDYSHIKTGRGSAQVRIKFRDVRSGAIIEQTFQAGTKFSRARVERREMQYLYSDDQFYYFMNTETYEQIPVGAEHHVVQHFHHVDARAERGIDGGHLQADDARAHHQHP